MKVGKTTVLMPYTTKYTKWQDTHTETKTVSGIQLGNKQLNLIFTDKSRLFATEHFHSEEKFKHNHDYYVKLFQQNNIKHHYGDWVKIEESYIKNHDYASVFGEYKNNNHDFEIVICGSEKKVDNYVRSNICQFSYFGMVCAVIVLILSIIGGIFHKKILRELDA